ncbi:uncharacterized protein V1518DRAFT_431565 [Limtongia smithiae]|uniref:uncharacterized protein n=1 Tax=Limtongia smithiae TaxID=1125753 RepID=UPI0034CFDE4F
MSYNNGDNNSYGGYGGGNSNNSGGYFNSGYKGNDGGDSTKYGSQGSERVLAEGKTRLRPITLKQAVEAEQAAQDAEFFIDGVEVANVIFVGIIRSIAQQATNTTYRIEDDTATFDIKAYPSNRDKGAEFEKRDDLYVGQYVRVIGDIKAFNNRRYITGQHIHPVTDFNEVIYRRLETLAVHLQTTRGSSTSGAVKSFTAGGNQFGNFSGESLSGLQSRIMSALSTTQQNSNEGLHFQMIARQCGADVNEVRRKCDELCELGLVYTTIDTDHYKMTD